MLRLADVLREEHPRINAVLKREIAALPASVRPIAAHTLNAGGKRLRPLLAVYMGRLFGCTDPAVYAMAAAIEFFHVATLIHDDVLDNAPTRRGMPAAHAVYSPTTAILGGDAMLAHSARIIARIGDCFISQQFAEAVMATAVGEIDEFHHQGNVDFSYDTYLAMITGKTAWSLKAACQLPARFAGAGPAEVEAAALFGLELGVAFQIVDDALDIAPSQDTGKPAGGDLRERKCTPLVHFYYESLSEAGKKEFAAKFRDGSLTEAEIATIIAAMLAKNMDAKTRDLAGNHLERAKAALMLLPDNAERDVLALVPEFIKNRGN